MDATGREVPLLGHRLDDRYRLDRPIARGGMATVYAATDTRLDRPVAVKVLRRSLAEDPDFVDRFAREARAAARLSTPDVVAVHDQGHDAATGATYLVMELVPGRTLRDVVVDEGALPPGRALALIEPVLRALAAAHAAGLVHRDVKPENVLLGDDGRVKVADFGLARAFETSGLTATSGLLIGTVAYLAPEQVEHGRADPRTDVYAAGVLLFELLTGTPPYTSDSPMSVMFRHVHEDVPPPGTLVGGVPAALDELVVRATRRDPSARPVDAGQFLAELRVVRADLAPGEPDRPRTHPTLIVDRPPAPPAPPARRRRRVRLAFLSVLLVALAAVGAFAVAGYTRAPSVLGMTRVEAEAALRGAGLQVRYRPSVPDEVVPAQRILTQDPGPRGRVRHGGTVVLLTSLGPDRRVVPVLPGRTRDAAVAELQRVGLRVGAVTQAFDSTQPAGAVVSSAPAAGARLRPGTTVDLVVSRGPDLVTVPDVTGDPLERATAALERAGVTASPTEVFSDGVPKGSVVAQSPPAGRVERGSTVTLQVSKGPELVVVPDLRGRSTPAAREALRAIGLRSRAVDLPDGQGVVIAQSPGAGNRVRRGSTVTFYVL